MEIKVSVKESSGGIAIETTAEVKLDVSNEGLFDFKETMKSMVEAVSFKDEVQKDNNSGKEYLINTILDDLKNNGPISEQLRLNLKTE